MWEGTPTPRTWWLNRHRRIPAEHRWINGRRHISRYAKPSHKPLPSTQPLPLPRTSGAYLLGWWQALSIIPSGVVVANLPAFNGWDNRQTYRFVLFWMMCKRVIQTLYGAWDKAGRQEGMTKQQQRHVEYCVPIYQCVPKPVCYSQTGTCSYGHWDIGHWHFGRLVGHGQCDRFWDIGVLMWPFYFQGISLLVL